MSNYKSNHKKKFLAQKGQVAVIVALLIVCLVGIAALVVDIGSLYRRKAFLQTVADSAALAGAQELPGNPEDPSYAINAAIDYADRNNVDIVSSDVEISSSTLSIYGDTIKVTISEAAPVYFAGVLGINTVDVGASATAMVGEPEQVYNVVPWAAIITTDYTNWWDALVPGTDKWIATYDRRGKTTGNFCAWYEEKKLPRDWKTVIYPNRIINGYSSPLSVGNTIYVQEIKMGDTVPPTNTRVGVWDPFSDLVTIEGGSIKLAKSSDNQLVIVPVIEGPKKAGESATILAFAPFILEGIRGGGKDTQIYGRFIDQALIVYEGDVKGVEPAGLRVIRLIR